MKTFKETLQELKQANKELAKAFNDLQAAKASQPIEPIEPHVRTIDLVDDDGIYLPDELNF